MSGGLDAALARFADLGDPDVDADEPTSEATASTFADGTPRPAPSILPHALGTPTLEQAVPAALAARAAGRTMIYLPASGDGRPWAAYVDAFGMRGRVVRRYVRQPTTEDVQAGRPVEAGSVAMLSVEFAVTDVFLAARRKAEADARPVSYGAAAKPRRSWRVSMR